MNWRAFCFIVAALVFFTAFVLIAVGGHGKGVSELFAAGGFFLSAGHVVWGPHPAPAA